MSKLTDSVKVVPNRRARVQLSLSLMKLQMADSLGGTANIPRPIVGGNTTGLHYQPQPYDEVIALAEVNGWHSTAVSAVTTNTTLPNYLPLLGMNPGETAIFGADGRQVAYVRSDGSTYLYSKSTGAQIIVTSTQNLQLSTPTGGTISVSAGATGTILITGLSTFQQLATYQGGLTATGAVNINTTGTGQTTAIGDATNPTSVGGVLGVTGLTTGTGGFSVNGTNKISSILVFTATVSSAVFTATAMTQATYNAPSFTNPTYGAPGFSPATYSGASASSTGSVNVYPQSSFSIGGWLSTSSGGFVANASISSTPPTGASTTAVSTGVSWNAGTFYGGAITSGPPLSLGGSVGAVNSVNTPATVTIGTGTISPSWSPAVSNVAVGDYCIASIPALASHPEITWAAQITSANTIVITFTNVSTTTVTITNMAINLLVLKAS